MAAEVILPKLGMNTESATIVRWHKREGDRVAVGDVLVEVETDKATIEVEAEAAGVLRKVLAGEQERVAISQTIALIGAADEDVSALVPAARAAAPAPLRHAERVYQAWRGTPPAATGHPRAPDSFPHRLAQPPAATPAPAPTWVRTCQEAGASATAAGDATALPVLGRDSGRGQPELTGQTSSPHPPSPSAEKGPGGEVTRPPRLDPEAIRARLVQRGVLAPPGRAAGPIPPAPIPTREQDLASRTPHTPAISVPPNGGSADGEPGPLARFPTRAEEMPTVGSADPTGPPARDGVSRARGPKHPAPFPTRESGAPPAPWLHPAPEAVPADPRWAKGSPERASPPLAEFGVSPNSGVGRETVGTRTRLAIYGSGLGAKQLLEIIRLLPEIAVVGLIDDNPTLAGAEIAGLRVLGGFAALADLAARGALDGVTLSFHSEVRRKIHRRIAADLGLRIVPLVDPRAVVGMSVQVGDGALIEAAAVVGPGTMVGEGTIVDVGAVVAHDCFLGPFSHLSPGCHLSGVVHLIENVLVGVGASINSTVTVGRNVIIAPGAGVMNDVPDDVVVSGVPAKVIGGSRRGA